MSFAVYNTFELAVVSCHSTACRELVWTFPHLLSMRRETHRLQLCTGSKQEQNNTQVAARLSTHARQHSTPDQWYRLINFKQLQPLTLPAVYRP
jgi:hypothetical protein